MAEYAAIASLMLFVATGLPLYHWRPDRRIRFTLAIFRCRSKAMSRSAQKRRSGVDARLRAGFRFAMRLLIICDLVCKGISGLRADMEIPSTEGMLISAA